MFKKVTIPAAPVVQSEDDTAADPNAKAADSAADADAASGDSGASALLASGMAMLALSLV